MPMDLNTFECILALNENLQKTFITTCQTEQNRVD